MGGIGSNQFETKPGGKPPDEKTIKRLEGLKPLPKMPKYDSPTVRAKRADSLRARGINPGSIMDKLG